VSALFNDNRLDSKQYTRGEYEGRYLRWAIQRFNLDFVAPSAPIPPPLLPLVPSTPPSTPLPIQFSLTAQLGILVHELREDQSTNRREAQDPLTSRPAAESQNLQGGSIERVDTALRSLFK
jgi:hypothetical protein